MSQSSYPPIRRYILLALLACIAVFASLVLVISPLIINFAPQAAWYTRQNYIWVTLFLVTGLIGPAYWYLAPIARLRKALTLNRPPTPELIYRARRVAFNAPAYLFVALVVATLIATFMSNLIGAAWLPGYELAPYFSESLLIIATSVCLGLLLSLIARRQLRVVLAQTTHLVPRDLQGLKAEGHRLTIRSRLLAIILALNVVACYLPSILTFNLIYHAVETAAYQRHEQWITHTAENVAPLLDDEALVRYVEEVSLPDDGQAFIIDQQGAYLSRPPTAPGSDGQSIERSIQRADQTWSLGVSYHFRTEEDPLVRRTLLTLLVFDLTILGFTLPFAFAVTTDISDDLRQITQRLLEVAWRGEVGEKLPILSLDELGDLVRAFNDIQTRVRVQQETLQQEHRRLLALQAISSRISAIFDLDQLLDELAKSARTIFGYHNTLVLLADETPNTFHVVSSGYTIDDDVYARRFHLENKGRLRQAIETKDAWLIPDLGQHEFAIVSSPTVKSAIVAPMFARGKPVGLFIAESDRVNAFDNQDVQLVTSLANQAGATVEAVRLLQESRAQAEAMEQWAHNLMTLNQIATSLASSLDAHEILDTAVWHLIELTDIDYGAALILEDDGQHGRVIAEHPVAELSDFRLSIPSLPAAEQALTAGSIYQVDATTHPALLDSMKEQGRSLDFQSLLLIPLIARDELIGILLLASQERPHRFTDEEKDMCQTVASQAAVAVANARLVQDIQQQQRALLHKSRALTAESSKLDAILHNVADGLVVTDNAGHIILCNPAFREIAGQPLRDSLRNRPLVDCFPLDDLQELIHQTFESPKQISTKNLDLENGRVLKASATALQLPPAKHETGEFSPAVITVLRDITREVELDRTKTNFISAVSHELRTPLTSVMGFASLIRRDLERRISPHLAEHGDPRQAAARIVDNLDIIEQESLRITRLIDDMLDIAKMEAGRMEWRMETLTPEVIINQATSTASALAREKGLPLHTLLRSGGLPAIHGDRDRLIQVITNLLANAIKFTDHGRVEVRGWSMALHNTGFQHKGPVPDIHKPFVEICKLLTGPDFQLGTWVIISIADTGVGFAAEDISYIFEKYRQVGTGHDTIIKGTGLGLPISKEIVEHHGGHMWATSKQGKGSTFSFALPVNQNDS